MKKNKVVIVGGGSTWTPGLLKSLCVKKDDFPLEELRLFDTDGRGRSQSAGSHRYCLQRNTLAYR